MPSLLAASAGPHRPGEAPAIYRWRGTWDEPGSMGSLT